GAEGYAVIDLQPGMADFLDQAKLYEDLLTRPGVGLALDPAWKMAAGQQPGAQVGTVGAAAVNRAIEWRADPTRDPGGTTTQGRPEAAGVLHADGHGPRGEKMETWDLLRRGLPTDIRMAWKNFYDEDTPTFTPEETMEVSPRPWFVSYQ